MSKRLEYAKVVLREDKIKVEIRDGAKIVQRSPGYFLTEQLADKWIAERKQPIVSTSVKKPGQIKVQPINDERQ